MGYRKSDVVMSKAGKMAVVVRDEFTDAFGDQCVGIRTVKDGVPMGATRNVLASGLTMIHPAKPELTPEATPELAECQDCGCPLFDGVCPDCNDIDPPGWVAPAPLPADWLDGPKPAECVSCFNDAAPGQTRCQECIERDEWSDSLRSSGPKPVCPECGEDDGWLPEDGRGNVLCECQQCEWCGLADAYGMHNPGCPATMADDEKNDVIIRLRDECETLRAEIAAFRALNNYAAAKGL